MLVLLPVAGSRKSPSSTKLWTAATAPPFGFHLWSATYDRDLRDVLDVQTDVARQIGKALALELLPD
jgi:TolB-like protein